MSFPYSHPFLGLSNGLNTKQGGVAGAGVGGWVELGRHTLSSAQDDITVSSLSDKRYYMVLSDVIGSAVPSVQAVSRLGSGSVDSGSNYAGRRSENGGGDATYTSQTLFYTGYNGNPEFKVQYIANLSNKEKLVNFHTINQNTAGAGNAPIRLEGVWKWVNTSNPLDIVNYFNNGAGDFASGSEVVVLGWDPADTHTNNFWEELASVELGSANATIDSSTISAKKYLWFQVYVTGKSTSTKPNMQFNSDTASNYARRFSVDGGADTTEAPRANIMLHETSDSTPTFVNGFIINNQSNEKLYMGHAVNQSTAGAGTAPNRCESIGKWANTSNQITSIQVNANSGTFGSGSILKVFGSD